MSSTIGFRPARNLAGGSRYIETQPVGDALRTLGTLNESLPEDTIPPLAGSIDESDALILPPVLMLASRIATRAFVISGPYAPTDRRSGTAKTPRTSATAGRCRPASKGGAPGPRTGEIS